MVGINEKYINLSKLRRFKFSPLKKCYYPICWALVMMATQMNCQNRSDKIENPQYGNTNSSQSVTVYHFAVHPLHNPTKLIAVYEPLMIYLNQKIKGVEFLLEASRDYDNFEHKYLARKPEFILPNPWQTIQAMNSGYHVIAIAGEAKDFKGLIIVRKDGSIKKPTDLIGKKISYPSNTALAACIMPQYFLFTQGVNVNKDIQNQYVGSQESSIMNVYLKNTSAGATWPPPWRTFQKDFPREAAELKVIWETESLINNSVMVRDDIPDHIKNQVYKCLMGLQNTEQGKQILATMETAGFLSADDKSYDIVKKYVVRFEKEVRKITTKK